VSSIDDDRLAARLRAAKVKFVYEPAEINPRVGVRAPFVDERNRVLYGFKDEATPYDAMLAEGQGWNLILVDREELD